MCKPINKLSEQDLRILYSDLLVLPKKEDNSIVDFNIFIGDKLNVDYIEAWDLTHAYYTHLTNPVHYSNISEISDFMFENDSVTKFINFYKTYAA